MRIELIAAMARNRVIGCKGRLPWSLPEDLRRFRELTWGHPVLMGRKTYESIGKPLPGRLNIILTRNPDYEAPGCTVVSDLNSAFEAAGQMPEPLFVIGGEQIYRLCLPVADTLRLTLIPREVEGDAFFPEWPQGDFCEISRERIEGGQPFEVLVLERIGGAEALRNQ